MDPLIATAIFLAYFFTGILYAVFVNYINKGLAVKSATCSVIISLIMSLGIIQYTTNPWYLIPLLIGSWLGTYVAVRFKLGDYK
jgi:ABC-type Mn2+/Zn2+ transport system permease subunit